MEQRVVNTLDVSPDHMAFLCACARLGAIVVHNMSEESIRGALGIARSLHNEATCKGALSVLEKLEESMTAMASAMPSSTMPPKLS